MYTEVVSNWWKAVLVGDFIEGTLINRKIKEGTDPQGRPQTQMVYEIKADAGMFHNLIKNKSGNKVPDEVNPVNIEKGEYFYFAKGSIDNAMKKIKNGQKVRLAFDSIIESKDKMKNDFKLVKVYAGEMDQKYLNSQWEEVPEQSSDGEVKIDGLAF